MRRAMVSSSLAATLLLLPLSAANAEHTGCQPHDRTQTAHAMVPHHSQGNHTAHESIPYCPPEDAPR